MTLESYLAFSAAAAALALAPGPAVTVIIANRAGLMFLLGGGIGMALRGR